MFSREVFKPNQMYINKDFRYAFNLNKPFDNIIIGNSKSISALSAKVLSKELTQKTIQLGFSSGNISVTKLILESAIKKNPNIKNIILEVSWFTFNNLRTTFHKQIVADLIYNNPSLLINIKDHPNILGVLIYRSFKKIFDYVTNTKYIKSNYYNRYQGIINNKYRKNYSFDTKKAQNLFGKRFTAGIDKKLLNDFLEIIRICKTKNINLILYTAPEDELYTKSQNDKKSIKQFFQKAALHNKNIHYLDFTIDGSFFDKNFENLLYDSHHIFHKEIFTKHFIDATRKIYRK